MSPVAWVILVLLAVGVSCLAGVFIGIANDESKRTQAEIDADVEEMLRGEK